MGRNSRIEAVATRELILDEVVADASLEGLDGVTIGRLASRLGMSKAGLIGPFGNKEQLQLAALERASEKFQTAVWKPAAGKTAGLDRLEAIIEAWLTYLAGETFPGGCFLTQAAAEFDGRPGPIHDRVRSFSELWLKVLEREAATAMEDGLIDADADPAQIAFELNGIAQGTNQAIQLNGDRKAIARGRVAMRRALRTSLE